MLTPPSHVGWVILHRPKSRARPAGAANANHLNPTAALQPPHPTEPRLWN